MGTTGAHRGTTCGKYRLGKDMLRQKAELPSVSCIDGHTRPIQPKYKGGSHAYIPGINMRALIDGIRGFCDGYRKMTRKIKRNHFKIIKKYREQDSANHHCNI